MADRTVVDYAVATGTAVVDLIRCRLGRPRWTTHHLAGYPGVYPYTLQACASCQANRGSRRHPR